MATTTRENPTRGLAVRDLIFAELALRDGKTPAPSIDKGQKVIEEMSRFGINRSLPSILLERNLMDKPRERDLTRLLGEIEVPCPQCRRKILLIDLGQEGHLRCGQCQSLLDIQLEGAADGAKVPIEDRLKFAILESGTASRGPAGAPAKGPARPAREPAPTAGPKSAAPARPERTPEPEPRNRRRSSVSAEPLEPPPRKKAAFAEPPEAGGSAAPRRATRPGPGPRPPAADHPPRPAAEHIHLEDSQDSQRKLEARDAIKNYRIEGAISSGPSGRLYRASPADGAGPPVALKVISLGRTPDLRAIRMLEKALAEWNQLGAEFTGPHEVREEGSTFYLVRPHLDDSWTCLADLDLKTLSDPSGVLRAVATRLGAVHEAGVIHGNLKLSNVFLKKDNLQQVFLVDPGLRLLLPRDELARWKVLAGAPRYIAPEEIAGGGPTVAGDLYALGWILYALLSGALPFAGQSPPEILRRHREGPCPELPVEAGGLSKLHLALTALAPEERPASGAAVADLFTDALTGKKLALGTVTPRPEVGGADPRRGRKKSGRWPLRYLLGPAALIAAIGVCGLSFMSWQNVRTAFADRKRPVALFHKLAEKAFEETKARADHDPRVGSELWEQFLRTFSETPLRGAAEAEKRNCNAAAGMKPK